MCVTASLCSTVKINTLNQSYFNQKIKIGKKKHSLNLCQRKNDALMDELVSGQRVKGACLHLPHMTPLLLPQHRFHSLSAVCVLPIDPNLDQAALVPHASGLKPHHCQTEGPSTARSSSVSVGRMGLMCPVTLSAFVCKICISKDGSRQGASWTRAEQKHRKSNTTFTRPTASQCFTNVNSSSSHNPLPWVGS